jgi:Ribonuclease G/E
MKKDIFINQTQKETRIAIHEDDVLVELYVEKPENVRIVGNIYKGVVENVLPGMQAAFVDIGIGANSFLPFSEVEGESFLIDSEEDDNDDNDDDKTKSPNRGRSRNQSRRHEHRTPTTPKLTTNSGSGNQRTIYGQRCSRYNKYFFTRPVSGSGSQRKLCRYFTKDL